MCRGRERKGSEEGVCVEGEREVRGERRRDEEGEM